MRNQSWLKLTMAALLVSGGLVIGKGTDSQSGQRPARQKWLETVKEKLSLSDEQTEKITAILRGEKETIKDLVSALYQARVGLRQAIQAANANEASVRLASAKVAAVESDMAVERFKLYERISPILSSEQLEKLKQVRARMDESIEQAIERSSRRLNSE